MTSLAVSDSVLDRWEALVAAIGATQQRILSDVERTGVPAPFLVALRLLSRTSDGRLPMSQLAREMSLTSGAVTKIADRMARDGLIDRRASADDRRVVYAALTPRGRSVADAALDVYRASFVNHVLEVLDEDELTGLAAHAAVLAERNADPTVVDEASFLMKERDLTSPERRGQTTLPAAAPADHIPRS